MPAGPMIVTTTRRRTTLVAFFCVLALAAAPARADDDDDLIDKSAKPAANEREIIFAAPGVDQNIDNWVYGNDDGANSAQETLESRLQMKTGPLARTFNLSDNQKQKLLLAGRGDIRRFLGRVEQLKSRYHRNRLTVDDWRVVRQESLHLRASLSGLFAGDSLFAKTLSSVLTPEQFASLDQVEVERRAFQHRAGVHMTVLRLSTALGLSDDQWKRLEEVLLKETRPAQFTDRPYPAVYFNVVYGQMRSIPREKLQPIFEPWQWRIMQQKLNTARDFAVGGEAHGVVLDRPAGRGADLAPAVPNGFRWVIQVDKLPRAAAPKATKK